MNHRIAGIGTIVPFFAGSLAAAAAGAPGAATAAAVDAAAATGTMTVLEYVKSGGMLGYVLIALSIVGLALVIRNLLVLRQRALAPPELINQLEQRVAAGDLPGIVEVCSTASPRTFLAEVLRQAIERSAGSPFGMMELRSAVEDAGKGEAERLHRLNDGIGIIAAIGPMLGLLGTVLGMIGAFHAIGALEGAARSSELARFMSLALVNTAEGLIVAIPCTVAFALFRRRIDALVQDAGQALERLAGPLSTMTAPAGAAAGGGSGARQAPRAAAATAGVRVAATATAPVAPPASSGPAGAGRGARA